MLRILTTLCNARPYIGKCLATIADQSVRDWRCYVLNDLSTDGSEQIVAELANRDGRFILVDNPRKLYQAGAYLHVLNRSEIADDDICVSVDGDDWLPDEFVLERVLEAYADQATWMTWGSMLMYHGGRVHPADMSQPLPSWDNIRGQAWMTSHLRTWKAFLYRAIDPIDLCDRQGNYWRMSGDQAFMLPMLEMSGPEHAKFLLDYNYVYNAANPLSDHVVDGTLQAEMCEAIRRLPSYQRLRRA